MAINRSHLDLALDALTVWKVASWVPDCEDQDSEGDWNELKCNEVVLVVDQLSIDTLSSLRETEAGTDSDQSGGNPERNEEPSLAAQGWTEVWIAVDGDGEGDEQREEDEEGCGLECETSEKDVVRTIGLCVISIRLSNTDQCSSKDLKNGSNNIGSDENPEDKLWLQPFACLAVELLLAGPPDEARETDVDGGGDEDWRGDDEEVLYDEVDDVVWVLLGG